MGFYSEKPQNGATKVSGLGRWVAVVVLSALVGSGTTAALLPRLSNSGIGAVLPAAVSSSTPVTTSVTNVSVNDGIVQAVKKVKPAVMGVVNYSLASSYFSSQSQLQPTGVGTGVLFYKDNNYGYFVTNNHVVDGAAKVAVVLSSGQHVNATVVGTDPFTDLAVLKVPVKYVSTITPAQFANSNSIQVGEPAIAIGTPMGLDFADSVTAGIVSAKARSMPVENPQNTQQVLDYQTVIQTDASINPGNSGGPLLNIQGQVMGINSSKIVAQGFQGMGFAIPANEVQTIIEEIMKTGHAVHPALGIAGYSLSTLPPQYMPNVPVNYGVWVQSVTSQSAKSAGLKTGDVIVAIDNQTVQGMSELRTYLLQRQPGQTVTLKVYRGSQLLTLHVKLGLLQVSSTTTGSSSGSSGSSGGGIGGSGSIGGTGGIGGSGLGSGSMPQSGGGSSMNPFSTNGMFG